MTRPATRYGNTVVFEGGAVKTLSRLERALFALGIRKYLSTPHHERRSV